MRTVRKRRMHDVIANDEGGRSRLRDPRSEFGQACTRRRMKARPPRPAKAKASVPGSGTRLA